MKKTLPALAALIWAVAAVAALSPLAAQNRYALVIGNNAYRGGGVPALNNAVNDATDVAAALTRLGYQVDLRLDIDTQGLRQAVAALTAHLAGDPDSEGFFWYAGHGFYQNGEDCLLPVDVEAIGQRFDDPEAAFASPYRLQELFSALRGTRNRANVVMYDASRNKTDTDHTGGTGGTRGVWFNAGLERIDPGNNLVVLYSGEVGNMVSDGIAGKRNSPFAEAVLHNIEKPESLEQVMEYIAAETRALTGNQQRPVQEGFSEPGYSLNPAFAYTTQRDLLTR